MMQVEKKPILLALFYELKLVYFKRQDPKRIALEFFRNGARYLGFWPDEEALKNRFYSFFTTIVVFTLTIFWSTIAADLYTAGNNIVALGESFMFLLGVSIIYFKGLLTLKNWSSICEIIEIFVDLNSKSKALQNPKIKRLQRNYFITEACVTCFFHVTAFSLFGILSVQPLLSGDSTPLPALFPFNLQDPRIHPWGSNFVYIFQVYAIFHSLLLILYLDSLGGCSITQTSINLRILSVRLRELGLSRAGNLSMIDELRTLVEVHQKILSVNEKCNSTFYGTFILQMGTSTFMLGIAGFEALYAKDEPMVAFKFLFFMFVALMQLLYWCIVGNMVYFDSLDVSVAAFEAHEWFNQSPILQRNLMFMILRAQKPLVFRAKPLFPFTFETFTKIIKTSYTSFTLLCNTHE